MTCKTAETTNARLAEVRRSVTELIEWAEADAQHARESDAPETAEDDVTRANQLRTVLHLLEECDR